MTFLFEARCHINVHSIAYNAIPRKSFLTEKAKIVDLFVDVFPASLDTG
jgi:hypothetical protein